MNSEHFQHLLVEFQNPLVQDFVGDAVTLPLTLVETLIRIGYEPVAPTAGRLIEPPLIENTQMRKYRLPSTLKYLLYIKSVDGIGGLYRGFIPYVTGHLTFHLVYSKLIISRPFQAFCKLAQRQLRHDRENNNEYDHDVEDDELGEDEETDEKIYFLKETWWKIFCYNSSILVSHPFYVIAVRSMAQFVGRETKYNSLFGSIAEIANNEGLRGFYSGLIPRLIRETSYVILSSAAIFVIKKIFNNDVKSPDFKQLWVKLVAQFTAHRFAHHYSQSALVVADTMIVNNIGLAIGSEPHAPKYSSWLNAFDRLSEIGQISRGTSSRIYNGPFVLTNGELRPSHHFGPFYQTQF